MKRDFREEYQEYMRKKTPDLWSRIEEGISEAETQISEATELQAEKPDASEPEVRKAEKQIDVNADAGNPEKPADKRPEELRKTGLQNRESQEIKSQFKVIKSDGKEKKMVQFRSWIAIAVAVFVLGVSIGTITMLQNSSTVNNQTEAGQNVAKGDVGQNNQTGDDSESKVETGVSADEQNTPVVEIYDSPEEATDVQTETNSTGSLQNKEANREAFVPEMEAEEYYDGDEWEMAVDDSYETGLAYDSYMAPTGNYWDPYDYDKDFNNETYAKIEDNGFCLVLTEPLSTFSADVDTASYENVRRMIEDGYGLQDIYVDAVRAEEFINYFTYDLKDPESGEKFGVTTKIAVCPWNDKHQLLFVGMKTEDIDLSEAPAENLTFLIDVSGSMDEEDKLPLLQKSFLQLVEQLDDDDTVSIVTYANGVEVVLDSAKGSDKKTISDAINGLMAAGGTNGEGGIQKAYALAEANYREDANNRIIVATDGDLNIGISEPDQLEKLISEKRDKGIYLTMLGFGTGNIRDDNMERLADCGNGNYAYIDSLFEAKKVLVEELGASFHTVAEDVKLQVEFNPEKVNAYRLIGYENRLMDAADFRDDTKDAGEIGAGHSVIALYELIPAGAEEAVTLKYQNKNAEKEDAAEESESEFSNEYCTVAVRYKEPGETKAEEVSYVVDENAWTDEPDSEFVFASAVAELAMIIRDDANKGDASLDKLMELGRTYQTTDEYRQEFFYMVRLLAKNS